jgi:cellulose synthase/poly-beta-1,6-N-acetylglucosamine synthase-like glycosyltransferase
MKIPPRISVIIPSNHAHHDLFKIVKSVCCQTFKPAEIIIVDSCAAHGAVCPIDVSSLCEASGIVLHYTHLEQAFPGEARNIGLGLGNSELIAFIDVQTIPNRNWLELSIGTLTNSNIDGVFGSTTFTAKTTFERLIRDAFFGVLPRKTLPGSVFRREVFNKAGHFIDWVRAGEDTEWLLRLELLKIHAIYLPSALVEYVGLVGADLKSLLSKWYRNYSASHELPHLFPQKMFLWMCLYPLIIFIAFNWNYLIANWRMDSPFYIGHITKMAAIIPPLAYVISRGIVIPLRRGVGFSCIFPIRFIAIASIGFMADSVKALVFSAPKCKRD